MQRGTLIKAMLCGAAILATGALTTGGAEAAWPEKPIRVIVPFGPGGTSDQVTRAYQMAIQENDILPQPINVINVGGHYSIGARQVMEADADGYTFLTLHVALMGGEAGGMLDFGYRDFEPVAATGQFCVLPVVRKDSGIDSVDDLMAKAAAEPDTLIFGANLGAINHMAGIMLQNTEEGAQFRFVQIGGGTANFTALTGAQTDVSVLSAAEVINFTQLPDGSENPESQIKAAGLYRGRAQHGAARVPDHQGARPRHGVLHRQLVVRAQGHARRGGRGLRRRAGGGDRDARRSRRSSRRRRSRPLFLSGDALQASLDDTWARIEPVAKQAAQ